MRKTRDRAMPCGLRILHKTRIYYSKIFRRSRKFWNNKIETNDENQMDFFKQKINAISCFQLSDCDVNSICSECKQFLTTLDQFSERCMRVNTMFGIIISSNENLQVDPIYLQNLRDNAALANDMVCSVQYSWASECLKVPAVDR